MLDLRAITDKRLEELAAIEHEQWMTWARSILSADDVAIGPERLARWQSYMVPYADLPESVKEHDRVWARRVAMDHTYEALLAVAEAALVVCDPMVQDGGGDRWWSAHDDLARALLATLDARIAEVTK